MCKSVGFKHGKCNEEAPPLSHRFGHFAFNFNCSEEYIYCKPVYSTPTFYFGIQCSLQPEFVQRGQKNSTLFTHKCIRFNVNGRIVLLDSCDDDGSTEVSSTSVRGVLLDIYDNGEPTKMSCTRVERNVLLDYFDDKGGNLLKHSEGHPVAEDITCGCCYEEVPLKMMVQKYVEEYKFGVYQTCTSLPCLDTCGCKESFSLSEIRRILPNDVLERYEQRQAQEDIELAKLEDLVYCPFCNFSCQVDKDASVLGCPNNNCSKVSCIQCKEPNHMPLSCEEVEKSNLFIALTLVLELGMREEEFVGSA